MMQRRRLGQARQFRQQRRDPGFIAEQQKTRRGIAHQRNIGSPQHHGGRVVAAHRIQGDRQAIAHCEPILPRWRDQDVAAGCGITSLPS